MKERLLIVNGDDLGLSPLINSAIIRAHREGILTSASLLANAEYSREAFLLARENPSLGIGVHLTLMDAFPASSRDEIPSLLNASRAFYPSKGTELLLRILRKKLALKEVEDEWRRQLAMISDAGIKITHIDCHNHLQAYPSFYGIINDLAKEFSIPCIRIPHEDLRVTVQGPKQFFKTKLINHFAGKAARAYTGLRKTEHFFGTSVSGKLSARTLKKLIRRVPEGSTELMCHPGMSDSRLNDKFRWGYRWQEEFDALISPEVKQLVEENRIRLISYKDL